MAPHGAAYNVDWIFSNNSNVHVATDLAWFTTYATFPSRMGHLMSATAGTEVLGVGTVELEVRRSSTQGRSRKPCNKLVLEDVLYAPSYTCNILGGPIYDIHNVLTSDGGEDRKLTDRKTGATTGLLDLVKLWKLWLKGQPRGMSSLDPNGLYYINARWSESEMKRWQMHKASLAPGVTSNVTAKAAAGSKLSQLSETEKKWLKEHYGGEFKFLQVHGLKMHNDEDREEGRSIMRAFMSNDGSDDDDKDSEEEDEEDSFLRELEEDPMSHVGDYHFTSVQLDWIEKHYRHSGEFLISYGLKPYKDEDCEDGAAIVQSFMEEDR
ncbi:hypothetical protein LTR56_010412 [Elasticomyces elasticus]|nr:hypothetical protein LTR56_010412 [Elasticomyces elasticus]KAK3648496.1 hypothetical protein LTR22_013388 [Elasticomyces elasticus]KAK4916805.1 hypothetical protein LTR49_015249 [Elasticomyces elasticus]KAK5755955.1 hypothetical protein LTS12_013959 [Elasticomyces elasticus]